MIAMAEKMITFVNASKLHAQKLIFVFTEIIYMRQNYLQYIQIHVCVFIFLLCVFCSVEVAIFMSNL